MRDNGIAVVHAVQLRISGSVLQRRSHSLLPGLMVSLISAGVST